MSCYLVLNVGTVPADPLKVHANGMNELTLRDERYDGIFHLVTAAIGAEEHYSLENNEARSEPIDLAKEVKLSDIDSWLHLVR